VVGISPRSGSWQSRRSSARPQTGIAWPADVHLEFSLRAADANGNDVCIVHLINEADVDYDDVYYSQTLTPVLNYTLH
jgi:hypothetical protein